MKRQTQKEATIPFKPEIQKTNDLNKEQNTTSQAIKNNTSNSTNKADQQQAASTVKCRNIISWQARTRILKKICDKM